jgi:nucleolar protein 56
VPELRSTWFGTFLLADGRILSARRVPQDAAALAERARRRLAGELTPEEEAFLAERGGARWTTTDRRLADRGLELLDGPSPIGEEASAPPSAPHREALLREAERALDAAWDPSIHVEEAVRAAADLDRVRNLLGERLGSWAARDAPGLDAGDHDGAARIALEPESAGPLRPVAPGLREARRSLAELYRAVAETQRRLSEAVAASVPAETPNLNALLGPELAARLLAQAGGLDRLARLPASTIQVLGAERAFFEHLRGRAPPPRHGLLFLHSAIQTAPRGERGKLARALAGKVAIAARLDRGGAAIEPALAAAFERRRAELKAQRGRVAGPAGRRRSRPPLDAAPRDG